MKTVNFIGRDWEVPDWANYIVHDRLGGVEAWKDEPVRSDELWLDGDGSNQWEFLGVVQNATIQKI